MNEKLKLYKNIIEQFRDLKIAVIGDFMLDRYIWGNVNRISPEAPVPVVKVESTEYRLGGAGNVAANLASLGCEVDSFGLIGDDNEGLEMNSLLKKTKINSYLIKSSNNKRTTVKTRIVADKQQVTRVDEENIKDISSTDSKQLLKLMKNTDKYDAVIISDYGKGVIANEFTRSIIKYCIKKKKIIVVDPKGNDYKKYKGATTIKPNLKEFKRANNQPDMELKTENLENYAHKMRENLDLEGIVITLGKHGVFIQNPKHEYKIIPTTAQDVFDVSGAGDTFTAIFTMVLAIKRSWFLAGNVANHGSGVVVGKVGTSYITRNELVKNIK